MGGPARDRPAAQGAPLNLTPCVLSGTSPA